jgi:hypothetical protein
MRLKVNNVQLAVIAHQVEQLSCKQQVRGSSPRGGSWEKKLCIMNADVRFARILVASVASCVRRSMTLMTVIVSSMKKQIAIMFDALMDILFGLSL